jgi:hypothetical protein
VGDSAVFGNDSGFSRRWLHACALVPMGTRGHRLDSGMRGSRRSSSSGSRSSNASARSLCCCSCSPTTRRCCAHCGCVSCSSCHLVRPAGVGVHSMHTYGRGHGQLHQRRRRCGLQHLQQRVVAIAVQ